MQESVSCYDQPLYDPRLQTQQTMDLKYLHGIRGLAAIGVVWTHLTNDRFNSYFGFETFGQISVAFFFSLSAFLLTSFTIASLKSNSESKSKDNSIWTKYWIRRICKIYPMYTLAIWYAIVLRPQSHGIEGFWKHFFLIRCRSVFWCIAVEFTYYFFIPFICIAYCKMDKMNYKFGKGALVFFLVFVCFYTERKYPFGYEDGVPFAYIGPYFSLFIPGSIAAILTDTLGKRLKQLQSKRIASHMCLLIVFYLVATTNHYGTNIFNHILGYRVPSSCKSGFAAASVLFLSANFGDKTPFNTFFQNNLLQYFGDKSLSIFLTHVSIMELVMDRTDFAGLDGCWVVLALTLFVSHFTHLLIEVPGVNFGKFLCSKLTKKRVATVCLV